MSMTLDKIKATRALAVQFIADADALAAKLHDDHNPKRWNDSTLRWEEPAASTCPPGDAYSYGSRESGQLRRRSMDLTRSLAELRKSA